jgi:hypothetical protein
VIHGGRAGGREGGREAGVALRCALSSYQVEILGTHNLPYGSDVEKKNPAYMFADESPAPVWYSGTHSRKRFQMWALFGPHHTP